MKQMMRALALFGTVVTCSAQTVSFESVRLADTFIASTWPAMEKSIPVLISGMQSQLAASGATESASKILSEETQRSMTRENVAKAVALVLTERLSEEELKDLGAFMRSSLGQKYLQVNNELTSNPRFFGHILKQACEASNRKLSTADRASIVSTCGRL